MKWWNFRFFSREAIITAIKKHTANNEREKQAGFSPFFDKSKCG